MIDKALALETWPADAATLPSLRPNPRYVPGQDPSGARVTLPRRRHVLYDQILCILSTPSKKSALIKQSFRDFLGNEPNTQWQ